MRWLIILLCVFGFAFTAAKSSTEYQTPNIQPQQKTSGRLDYQRESQRKQDTAQQSPTTTPQIGSPVSEQKNPAHSQNREEEGTEFWPAFFGYRLKVTDTLIAAFTLLLFGATWLLHRSTKKLVKGADLTAERELRAYVAVVPANLLRFDPAQLLVGNIMMVNGGKTPAYNVEQQSVMSLEAYPLPPNFPFPNLNAPRNSRYVMPPNIQFGGQLIAPANFTQNQLIEILQAPAQGGRRLYFFGQIDYTDAFGKRRYTRFCANFQGRHDLIPLAAAGNWAGIAAAMQQPGFSMSFEFSAQHNEAN